jgi:hypothetical protein
MTTQVRSRMGRSSTQLVLGSTDSLKKCLAASKELGSISCPRSAFSQRRPESQPETCLQITSLLKPVTSTVQSEPVLGQAIKSGYTSQCTSVEPSWPVSTKPYAHQRTYWLRVGDGSDDRAPGGAVTVALCGHWNHEGACRWPHLSTIDPEEGGLHRLVIEFDASDQDLEMVTARVDSALESGRLTGPDGRLSVWEIV